MHNKPVERILVHIATDQLIFAGSNTDPKAPTMYGVLRSIGSVTADDNRQIVQVLTKLLHEQLHIAPIEIRIFFGDFAPEMVAFNGKIVTDILTGKWNSSERSRMLFLY